MSKWLMIGTETKPKAGFTDIQVLKTLQQMGREVFYVEPNSFDSIPEVLKNNKIDVIYFESINGWTQWDKIKGYEAKKINTWFDDPIQRIDLSGIGQVMKDNHQLVDVRVWDSYWSDRLRIDYQIESTLTHLAVDENEYYTTSLACSNNPIFIGALHSIRKIANFKERLCHPFKGILNDFESRISGLNEVPSWDKIEGHYIEALEGGDKRLYFDIAEMDRPLHAKFRNCIWMMCKNEVRLRMLRAALEVSEVTVFAECDQVNHPSEGELRSMIGRGEHKMIFHNTSGVSPKQLAMFNHFGWVHLQAVDPQSVNEGYPYRVFQTLASGKVLLTDIKAKWGYDFSMGDHMVPYDSMEEFKDSLNRLLKNKDECKSIGSQARKIIEEKHTWKNRL